ncbi:unnamed protein product [Vitrella brassicaformis CCMP3155]|uniref:Uncharacterized protein n=2 Tax=Vitrella brassicaformis TaxID=1169539 RepID=A0A0G4H7G4_VITBC|nr:unnamed protein product [Vitrella brassicaformis CCMP3155]|eukprot:CEM39846.1 unnamed protein product [Vitrella brassicaformis CCMP3155]
MSRFSSFRVRYTVQSTIDNEYPLFYRDDVPEEYIITASKLNELLIERDKHAECMKELRQRFSANTEAATVAGLSLAYQQTAVDPSAATHRPGQNKRGFQWLCSWLANCCWLRKETSHIAKS